MFTQDNELYYTLEKPGTSAFVQSFSPPALYPDGIFDPASTTDPALASGRRSKRKDRHSKINTAQGPRDRRMRLSLDVARKFFNLQDLLGFDKASKTVQWLLSMSKAAIRDLVSAASKCDVPYSESDEENISTVSDCKGKSVSAAFESKVESKEEPKEKLFKSKPVVQPKVGKESREKARARARERTLEKKMMRGSTLPTGCGLLHDLKSSLDFVTDQMEDHCSTPPWDHMSFANYDIIDEKVLLGEFLLQTSYGRPISTPLMFDHV